ncbi:MAG: hypothetical protein L3J66_12240 [Bacteroidales bacterium]|nr:hypothetical protein [Bacteroidales bacterium]
MLPQIPDNSVVEADASQTHFIHPDIFEIPEDFKVNAQIRNIEFAAIDLYKGKRKEPIPHFGLKRKGK